MTEQACLSAVAILLSAVKDDKVENTFPSQFLVPTTGTYPVTFSSIGVTRILSGVYFFPEKS